MSYLPVVMPVSDCKNGLLNQKLQCPPLSVALPAKDFSGHTSVIKTAFLFANLGIL
jgi:hypothetical protein